MAATDWDGDGDTTEGVKGEIDTLAETLYAEILKYAETTAGAPIVYDGHTNPYFFVDADEDVSQTSTMRVVQSATMPGHPPC